MCVVLRNRDRGDELKPPQIRIVENRFLRRADDALLRYFSVQKGEQELHYLVRVINKTA